MTGSGRVISLQITTAHRAPPRAVEAVRAIIGHGLEGDVHGKKNAGSPRQVLICDRTTLEAFGLRPGDLREQITVDFPMLEQLPEGARIRVGQATVEVTGPCEPCTHIGGLVGVGDPEAFRRQLEGRRGRLGRVIAVDGDGVVRVGDPIELLSVPAGGPA